MDGRDQTQAVAALFDPANHGGVRPDRIDTHACHVALAGDRAYKMKRAVTYAFLDYGTPALRRQAVRDELALNRRTAPEIYLGLVPLLENAEGELVFGALDAAGEASETVPAREWLIAMRRFPQQALLDSLADRGALDWPILAELADGIAAFHAATPPAPPEAFDAGEVGRLLAENIAMMREFPAILPEAEVDALEQEAAAALSRLGPVIDARAAAGQVKRCHGDLHLKNVVLWQGHPTLFDCIEFSTRYATTDVFYDLAFLLMDLDHRRLGDAANRVFNRYLESSGDRRGIAALPLYLSVRAQVRAKVGAASAAHAEGVEARAQAEEAAAYLALARRYLAPSTPGLTAIGGLSGSGKSTRARQMARALGPTPGAVLLRSDQLRKARFGQPETERLPPEAYRTEVSRAVYAELYEKAAAALAEGFHVIADATFLHPDSRRLIQAVAEKAGVPFDGIWLDVSRETAEARIAARLAEGADASDADCAVLARQLQEDTGPISWRRIPA